MILYGFVLISFEFRRKDKIVIYSFSKFIIKQINLTKRRNVMPDLFIFSIVLRNVAQSNIPHSTNDNRGYVSFLFRIDLIGI